jgi:hypothetical protein
VYHSQRAQAWKPPGRGAEEERPAEAAPAAARTALVSIVSRRGSGGDTEVAIVLGFLKSKNMFIVTI